MALLGESIAQTKMFFFLGSYFLVNLKSQRKKKVSNEEIFNKMPTIDVKTETNF